MELDLRDVVAGGDAPTGSAGPAEGDASGQVPVVRCRWCGRGVSQPARGRRREFCDAAHRQRAYAARRRGQELGLREDEVVLSRRQLESVQQRLEALRQALERASRTLTSSTGTQGYRDVVRMVRQSVGDLETLWLDPQDPGE